MMDAVKLLDLLAQREVIAVSPHPDDVAFSIGGAVRRLAASTRVTLLTIFTRNDWAPMVPAFAGVDAVSRLREEEDIRYARTLSMTRMGLGLPDTGVRGYNDVTERMAPLPGDNCLEDVRRLLGREIAALGSGTAVLCPLAVGRHLDHVIAHQVVVEMAAAGVLLAFYEDLPYATEMTSAELTSKCASILGDGAESWCVCIDVEQKLQDLSLYRSQVRPSDAEAILRHAAVTAQNGGYAERLWWRAHDRRSVQVVPNFK
jgi:LmbE family N-acetylglucosaminyl deacetylase